MSITKTKEFKMIISHLYLQILHSASESRFCVGVCFISLLHQADRATPKTGESYAQSLKKP